MKTRYPPSVRLEDAIRSQNNLPNDFILRGHLSIGWLRVLPQRGKSSAESSIVHLHLCLWKILFTQIWDFRNRELHGKSSLIKTYERPILKQELVERKSNAAEKIGAEQVYLVDYDLYDLDKWPTTATKHIVERLAHVARNYKKSVLTRQPLTCNKICQSGEHGT